MSRGILYETERRFVAVNTPISRNELTRRLRREFARYHFQVPAEIGWQSRKIWGRVTEVSRGGLFIEMDEPPCLGAHFVAQLALNVPLKINCIVRRAVAGRGIGVEINVPEQSRKRFQALLLALSAGADPVATAAKAAPPDSPRSLAKAAAASGKR
jgi:hypothetical protein